MDYINLQLICEKFIAFDQEKNTASWPRLTRNARELPGSEQRQRGRGDVPWVFIISLAQNYAQLSKINEDISIFTEKE